LQTTKAEISLLDSKIEKLMNAYLENALSLEEYRESKNKLVNEKQLLKEKLSAFEQKANNRFELTEKFLKYNMELANEGTNEEKLHLFKKVGSNFQIIELEPYFLSHAERGKPFQIQDSAGGIFYHNDAPRAN
jgi:hypothetical protein